MTDDDRILQIERRLDSMASTLDSNNRDTAELLDILRDARGFFKVTGYITVAVKWLIGVGVAAAAAWHAWVGSTK
jgi:hypothetical protein